MSQRGPPTYARHAGHRPLINLDALHSSDPEQGSGTPSGDDAQQQPAPRVTGRASSAWLHALLPGQILTPGRQGDRKGSKPPSPAGYHPLIASDPEQRQGRGLAAAQPEPRGSRERASRDASASPPASHASPLRHDGSSAEPSGLAHESAARLSPSPPRPELSRAGPAAHGSALELAATGPAAPPPPHGHKRPASAAAAPAGTNAAALSGPAGLRLRQRRRDSPLALWYSGSRSRPESGTDEDLEASYTLLDYPVEAGGGEGGGGAASEGVDLAGDDEGDAKYRRRGGVSAAAQQCLRAAWLGLPALPRPLPTSLRSGTAAAPSPGGRPHTAPGGATVPEAAAAGAAGAAGAAAQRAASGSGWWSMSSTWAGAAGVGVYGGGADGELARAASGRWLASEAVRCRAVAAAAGRQLARLDSEARERAAGCDVAARLAADRARCLAISEASGRRLEAERREARLRAAAQMMRRAPGG
ncbi:hypothetical protein HXX76_015072 [Chlamydomonas incerta]|uniref:Uncharacterized protein n=1 Tax=Chlamydomonas incerta TaxID=51695 RepID=A0A835SDZ7_CHLIN|nr:hypothetical protein HXX76_015072 [Chlamydomonas incerta]|eukprot:KAG2423796.1 hypothetical protein HXX76_015072 [Chlamydomonas incerta]